MTAAPHRLGIVVEGPSDRRTIPGLIDRILVDEVAALDGHLERARTYVGLDAGNPFLAWADVHKEAARRRVPRRHGHFGGEPGIEDFRTAVLALRCFVVRDPQPAAAILVRDSDGKQEDRVKGLEQARKDGDWPFPVVIGVAHPMRECWVLAGFEPKTKKEAAALAALRKELGFNPTNRSDRLDASKETATKSPKRVLSELTGGDAEREENCWTDAALDDLRDRGVLNGLSSFMGEVEAKLVPVFAGR